MRRDRCRCRVRSRAPARGATQSVVRARRRAPRRNTPPLPKRPQRSRSGHRRDHAARGTTSRASESKVDQSRKNFVTLTVRTSRSRSRSVSSVSSSPAYAAIRRHAARTHADSYAPSQTALLVSGAAECRSLGDPLQQCVEAVGRQHGGHGASSECARR